MSNINKQRKISKYLKEQGFGMAHIAALALTAIGMTPGEIKILGIPPQFTRESIATATQYFNCANQQELITFLQEKGV